MDQSNNVQDCISVRAQRTRSSSRKIEATDGSGSAVGQHPHVIVPGKIIRAIIELKRFLSVYALVHATKQAVLPVGLDSKQLNHLNTTAT
jgi:hypothetical protein